MRRKHQPAAPVTSESTASEAPTAATAPASVVPTALVAPVAAAAAAAVAGPGSAKPKAVKTAKAAPVVVEAFKPAVPDQTDTASKTADPIRERHADKDKDDRSAGKAKLVRDSFTMPRADFALIALLKDRALGFKRPAKKSELLRAGLHALAALDDAKLQAALDGLAPVKAGRPKKG